MSFQPATCEKHGQYSSVRMGGRWTPCPTCSKERLAELERLDAERARNDRLAHLRAIAGVPVRMINCTFKNFDVTPEKKRAFDTFRAFTAKFDELAATGPKLTVLGTTGTGKTHLACAMISELVARGIPCRYAEVNNIALEVRSTYAAGSNRSELEVLNYYAGFDLLVLDEFGAGNCSDHEKRIAADLLAARHNNCKPTIIISNLARQVFQQAVGDYIWSRLHENGRFLVMDWDDQRMKGARAASQVRALLACQEKSA